MWETIMPGVWRIDAVEEDKTDLIERQKNIKEHLSPGFSFDELAPLEIRIEFAERLQNIRRKGLKNE